MSGARGGEVPNGRTPARVLLVEDLDAVGADVQDARRRAAHVQQTGREVRWVAVAPPGGVALEDAATLADALVAREDAGPMLAAMAAGCSSVILASAWEGGGPLTRWLPRDAHWWPTGWSAEGAAPRLGWMGGWMRSEHRLEPLDGAAAWGGSWLFGWSEVESPESRRPRLPLWDGDLVLALTGLDGPAGTETIAAFAQLAEEWSGIDLVAWSHPTPEVLRRTRASAIDLRIHSVGPAPRRAESSWLVQASVALVDGRARVSAGLLLRVLAAGCPLLWVGGEPRSAGVARWLEEQGCARRVESDAAAIAESLDHFLERGEDVEAAIEHGRQLSARHDARALADRLSHAMTPASGGRRAA